MGGAPSTLAPPRPACHLSPLPTYFTRRLPKLDFISVSKGRVYEHVNDNDLVQPVVWISPHLDTESTHTIGRGRGPQVLRHRRDQETRGQAATGQCGVGPDCAQAGSRARWMPCWQPPSVQRARETPGPSASCTGSRVSHPGGWGPGPPAAGGRLGAGLAAHSGADVPYKLIFPGLRLKKKMF